MPLYEAKCNSCGKIADYVQSVANYLDTPECCGQKMQKVILRAPAAFGDIEPYQSPIDGRPICSRSARREDLKRNGCRPWEGMASEEKEAAKARKEMDARSEAAVRECAERAWASLSSDAQSVLETGG